MAVEAVSLILEEPEWAELESEEDLLRYLAAHRDTVSAAVCSPTEAGVSCSMSHAADTPRHLASTVKIAVLVAYADAVERGRVSPDDEVSFEEWNGWYLPGTDGGAHPAALAELSDPATLDEVVGAMITHSDNAATDVVLDRVGLDQVDATLERLGVEMDPLHPLLGQFLLYDHEVVGADLRAEALGAIETWKAAGRPDPEMGGLTYQIDGTQRLDHRASPRMLATLLAATFSEALSEDARARIHHHLEWPMRKSGGSETVELLGTKGGALPGVLTEAMYVVPAAGPHEGQTRIVVLLMDEMPMAAWFVGLSSFVHQKLMIRVAVDTEWERRLAVALTDDAIDAVPTATPEESEAALDPEDDEPAED